MTDVATYLRAAAVGIAFAVTAALPASGAEDPVLANCTVVFEDEVMLPAKEAGALVNLAVKDGAEVPAGALLGRIDDSVAQRQRDAAQAGVDSALERSRSDVEIRFATKSAEHAAMTHQRMLAANRMSASAIAELEIREALLKWETTKLQIENAQKEQRLAMLDGKVKEAELRLAELAIERRTIKAPFSGEVVRLVRRQDEWVSPGDTILHLARFNSMRVEGEVLSSQFDPHEIRDCAVTVEVQLAERRTASGALLPRVESFPGRITFVSRAVDSAGYYKVRALVENRRDFGEWILRAGHAAKMTIHLGTAGGK
jgi:multidrug efflux pump subunit AcrA (membrane-fusion protein)